MKLHTINTGMFKLDGGAMFGVVPKTMWSKLNPPDENNMCTWAMRCLLIEDGDKLILIDNGIGNKQSDKFFGHYYLHGDDTLEKSLNALGFGVDDVTDMFLTHLHFDHCGGSVKWNSAKDGYETVFKNATYWSNNKHWDWATKPNAREKASFLTENIMPMYDSGQLKFVDDGFDLFEFTEVFGHTESMMLPVLNYKDKTIVYMADLIPSAAHIPVPYVMGYDTRPLLTLGEKETILTEMQQKGAILFFEHDPVNECGTLVATDKGIRLGETFKLADI
ncbi:MAG: MBL fold metallo-hydrolase [Sphingobacteriales bacterium JAD_PAG50586_3]|nr:MAG: MBL fold metallo-hydrolase [Sphingobacteriales bacterium JAD_PAG50586_3]